MAVLNDEQLVHAVLAGDKSAYKELYNRYAALIRAVCYNGTGNITDAQDMAQDVFILAYTQERPGH